MGHVRGVVRGLTAAGVAAAIGAAAQTAAPQVDDATLLKPPAGEWVTHGRDYAETRHSLLAQIDQSNVAHLTQAWSVEVGSAGKIETTPIV